MSTDKVMITISGLQDHEVVFAPDSQPDKKVHQVDLFQATDDPSRSPARLEDQSSSTEAQAPRVAAAGKKPWELASGDPTAINFRPDMSLHAKMEWVCENVPKMSRLRILREGATLLCNQLIAKHCQSQD